MSTSYPYHILLISNDPSLIRITEGILAHRQIVPIQANDAKEALTVIKSHKTLFSLVIVQQDLSDIPGVEFLKQVKTLCVGALRILVTRHFEQDLLLHVINQRLVHKYIGDSSDIEEFTAAIESGIRRFDRFREGEDLFAMVKKQNHRLYELGCQHMELTRSQSKEIAKLNTQIKSIRNHLQHIGKGHPDKLEELVDSMASFVQSDPDPQRCFGLLFSGVFAHMDEQFSSLQQQAKKGHDHDG